MFRKSGNVHNTIMNEIDSVKKTMISFEGFMRSAMTPETPIETLVAMKNGVCEAEAKADVALRQMIDSLLSEAFLPSTKKDLIEVATTCDRVANKCEHATLVMVRQNLRLPVEYTEEIMKILSICHAQFDILEDAISTMFSNLKVLVKDHSILDEIRRMETEVDVLESGLYEKIFAREDELALKMQMSDLVEMICDVSDIIENVADKLQIMLIIRRA